MSSSVTGGMRGIKRYWINRMGDMSLTSNWRHGIVRDGSSGRLVGGSRLGVSRRLTNLCIKSSKPVCFSTRLYAAAATRRSPATSLVTSSSLISALRTRSSHTLVT